MINLEIPVVFVTMFEFVYWKMNDEKFWGVNVHLVCTKLYKIFRMYVYSIQYYLIFNIDIL